MRGYVVTHQEIAKGVERGNKMKLWKCMNIRSIV